MMEENVRYRSAGQIKADMRRIEEEIRRTDEQINVRDLIVESVFESGLSAKQVIARLDEIVDCAKSALIRLRTLQEKLICLAEELEEVRCLGCR